MWIYIDTRELIDEQTMRELHKVKPLVTHFTLLPMEEKDLLVHSTNSASAIYQPVSSSIHSLASDHKYTKYGGSNGYNEQATHL